jgi:cysteine-rich repeat protein
MIRHRRLRHVRPCRTALLLVMTIWATTVHAHRSPLKLALWGGFDGAGPACQRGIAHAAAVCANRAWDVRNACLSAQVDGAPCDTVATTAAIQQFRADAVTLAERLCDGIDLAPLGFSLLDIDIDVDAFCQQLQEASASAVYQPALHGETIQSVDDTTRSCIAATARVATALMRFSFRARRRALDRIASQKLGPSVKLTLVDQAAARIERVRARLEQQVTTECPTFAAIYHRTAGTVLTLLAQRGDCLAGATYVQDAVLCPTPVCGNSMQELHEQCDDGNLIDGDGCHSDCTLEAAPSFSH